MWKLQSRALALFLLLAVPLFVCMPVNSDVALFDVQAERIQRGGILYRDIVEPNLPGVVWLHLAIRSIAGWSTEAMRLADLMIFGGLILLLASLIADQHRRMTFVGLAWLFYLSCNEWCHCQRDVWMLLPTALAMKLRFGRRKSQTEAADRANSSSETEPAHWRWPASAVLEGICWGGAFWIKPHVAIPAGLVILTGLLFSQRRRWTDAACVMTGGILAAVPGVYWMMTSGTWPHFWDMMLNWNPEYLEAGRARQSLDRWLLMFRRFYPWWTVHVVAVPLSVLVLRRNFQQLRGQFARLQVESRPSREVDLAVLYAGWLIQSLLLQHAMDYIHVPAIVLGLLLIVQHRWGIEVSVRRTVAAAFIMLVLLASPILKPERIRQWPRCFAEGSSHRVRAALAHGNFPQWQNLHRVSQYLKAQRVRHGQLTCQNVHSVHLFRELEVQPATRFWSIGILQELFPGRAAAIERAVLDSDTRFVVTEARESGVNAAHLPDRFPWSLPVVFQSGSYRVHAMPDTMTARAGRSGAATAVTR